MPNRVSGGTIEYKAPSGEKYNSAPFLTASCNNPLAFIKVLQGVRGLPLTSPQREHQGNWSLNIDRLQHSPLVLDGTAVRYLQGFFGFFFISFSSVFRPS